jgi:hypothetical protein
MDLQKFPCWATFQGNYGFDELESPYRETFEVQYFPCKVAKKGYY